MTVRDSTQAIKDFFFFFLWDKPLDSTHAPTLTLILHPDHPQLPPRTSLILVLRVATLPLSAWQPLRTFTAPFLHSSGTLASPLQHAENKRNVMDSLPANAVTLQLHCCSSQCAQPNPEPHGPHLTTHTRLCSLGGTTLAAFTAPVQQ
ncbi:hypothetical protein E2C01_088830 [Portunus trituberculatus]|uniref:Uncharacterized protein n=1 Tax=Portunus trituberculatus TaxID=210409 RepID=A0A5B7JFQ4_PORTR|nr:hypothetical protein [Portunus trituberculatus]